MSATLASADCRSRPSTAQRAAVIASPHLYHATPSFPSTEKQKWNPLARTGVAVALVFLPSTLLCTLKHTHTHTRERDAHATRRVREGRAAACNMHPSTPPGSLARLRSKISRGRAAVEAAERAGALVPEPASHAPAMKDVAAKCKVAKQRCQGDPTDRVATRERRGKEFVFEQCLLTT
jgi:hypothetical protein